MWKTIDYLKEPHLVANIQKYFGVKILCDGHCNNLNTRVYKTQCDKKKEYTITNQFWYYLFTLGTALGDEVFYASFIPFWFWNVDGAVGRRVVLVWTIVMYIGMFNLMLFYVITNL